MLAALTNGKPEGTPVIRRLLREPLLHFLLIGTALFVLYGALNRGRSDAPSDIVVSEARVEALAESFATVWMRPPTPEEIKGLVDDYIAEEIYYREAIAMGLDQDDTVIRRRLRQKMEFISEDAATATEPTDAELRAYLAAHPEKFLEPAELTFVQVYFSTEKRGDQARPSAEQLLAELQAGRGPAILADAGDPTLLPGDMQSASPQVIANAFGSDFAAQIAGGARRPVDGPAAVRVRPAPRAGGRSQGGRDARVRADPSDRAARVAVRAADANPTRHSSTA